MEKKPDTTTPGIDKQGQGFLRKPAHDQNPEHEKKMKEAVAHDREFYEDPENPGHKFNLNDQAYSQSSPKDFVKTHSKFHHSDDSVPNLDPEN